MLLVRSGLKKVKNFKLPLVQNDEDVVNVLPIHKVREVPLTNQELQSVASTIPPGANVIKLFTSVNYEFL
jgi:hypothetical protein